MDEKKQSAARDAADEEPRPRIRSLLEIDPWKDVPGKELSPSPSKIPRLEVSPQTEASEDSGSSQENPDAQKPRAIRSLLDINPFESLDSQNNKVAAEAAADKQESGCPRIPSLLDIDPFKEVCRSHGHNAATWPQKSECNGNAEQRILKEHEQEYNSLMTAIQERDCPAVCKITDLPGINVNAITHNGDLPLTMAARLCDRDICQQLLSRGADVNLYDWAGRTALHYVAQSKPEDWEAAAQIMDLMLSRGAKVELKDKDGFTAFLLACNNANCTLMQRLIAYGCDLRATAYDGSSALHLAVRKGNLPMVQLLLQHDVPVNVRETTFETPLILAARSGDAAIVNALIEAGCDLDAQGFMEYTALHWAVHGGYGDVARALVAAGADMNAQSALMRTPLHRAVTAGHADIVAYLIEAGSDTEVVDANGETPLITATRWGFADIVRVLLKGNANPNPFGRRAKNPIIKAIASRWKEIVELLLAVDCDLTALQITRLGGEGGGKFQWLETQDSVQQFIRTHAEMLSKPRSLKRLCRSAIRQRLGFGFATTAKIEELPLPTELKEFLVFAKELPNVPEDKTSS